MAKPTLTQVRKLYIANLLMGLVFWYGIEKLFMKSIGLDETAVGISTALMLLMNLLLDVPAGMLADKWSRKGMLTIAALALTAASVTIGLSHSLWQFLIGYAFYSLYVVSVNGTFQALMYDTLHEQGRSKDYTKYVGRAFGFFLGGAAVGNALGGLIASSTTLSLPFFASVIPSILNIAVISSLHEPTFHKTENFLPLIVRLRGSLKVISGTAIIRALVIVSCMFWIVEVFKSDFGQIYFMRYVSAPEIFGLVWAAYAVAWAIGGVVAHRFDNRFTLLIFATTLPIIAMTFIDSWVGIILFLFQGLAMGILQNQTEATVQHATPSHVRASVLSVLSSLGRGVAIPASLMLGWMFKNLGVMPAVSFVSATAAVILLFWLTFGIRTTRKTHP